VSVGPRPSAVIHITALVERNAHIVWGARSLGKVQPLPAKVNEGFAGIYTGWMRENH